MLGFRNLQEKLENYINFMNGGFLCIKKQTDGDNI